MQTIGSVSPVRCRTADKRAAYPGFIQTFAFPRRVREGLSSAIQPKLKTLTECSAVTLIFRLLKLNALLLVVIFMITQRPPVRQRRLIDSFCFRVRHKRHRQMTPYKAAECLMQRWVFYSSKGERGGVRKRTSRSAWAFRRLTRSTTNNGTSGKRE